MDLSALQSYLLAKPDTREDTPFGPDALVYKVRHKLFAILIPGKPARLNLKCDPQQALILREQYPAIIPGYHMNKRHWNTLILDGSLPPGLAEHLIDHSFALVVAGMPKKQQTGLLAD